MRVGLARAVRLAVRNEFGSNAKSVPGVLPAAMAAAFRRQKAQRVQLGAFSADSGGSGFLLLAVRCCWLLARLSFSMYVGG